MEPIMMNSNEILMNKFNRDNIYYTIYNNKDSICITVYDRNKKGEFMHYYQVYDVVNEYCGDVSFKPIKNELFNNGNLFTNQELKALLNEHRDKLLQNGVINEDECCYYPDIVDYSLDNLFNII
jgi:hypothetical protein